MAVRFPCVSYEMTKRRQVPIAARVQRGTTPASCGTSTVKRWRDLGSQNAVFIFKPLVINPLFHMVQHLVNWVTPFPRSQHPLSSSLKFLQTPSSPLFLPTCTRVRGNHSHSSVFLIRQVGIYLFFPLKCAFQFIFLAKQHFDDAWQ